eukprot:scaffold42615_cov37-Tisochrysis_lutea.AAC.2
MRPIDSANSRVASTLPLTPSTRTKPYLCRASSACKVASSLAVTVPAFAEDSTLRTECHATCGSGAVAKYSGPQTCTNGSVPPSAAASPEIARRRRSLSE